MEKAIISEELFCEVMECQMIHHLSRNEKDIFFGWDDTNTFNINIHELSHKCKEWARNKHYIIVSALINNKDTARAKIKYSSKKDAFLDTETEYFNADTETEAIFKACQWIYEKINK